MSYRASMREHHFRHSTIAAGNAPAPDGLAVNAAQIKRRGGHRWVGDHKPVQQGVS